MNNINKIIEQEVFKGKGFTLLLEKFEDIEDPRVDRNKLHPLNSVLAMYLCAIMCNRTGWDEVYDFCIHREAFFQEILLIPHGIPSADTFSRVIQRINPKIIQKVTLEWHMSLRQSQIVQEPKEKNISIDGKTLRSSYSAEKKANHIVNVWCNDDNLVIAQEAVSEKENEIIALNEILENIDLEGSIVSIDAIGCQKNLAEIITQKKAHYLFPVKGNQPLTHTRLKKLFESVNVEEYKVKNRYHKTVEKDHGRIENREAYIAKAPTDLKEIWPGLSMIGMIISQRTIKGKTSTEKRYFITSKKFTPELFLQRARKHWGIENSLHWILDVDFGEDKCRVRTGFAPQNISWFRCLALSLLKKESTKLSIKRKMLKASDNLPYLMKVLLNSES